MKGLEHIVMEDWQKLPADRCKKLLNGGKNHLEPVIGGKGSGTKYQ